MAILTSKGARASHQLKGRRNVRISRDRTGVGASKIENIVDGLEKNISESINKYTKWIRDPLDIIEHRNGYCVGSSSINVPDNFSWGSRNIEYISENQAIITLTGVTSDGIPHRWVNIYNFGDWTGWKDTIN